MGTGRQQDRRLSSPELRGALLERDWALDMSTGPGRPHVRASRPLEAARMLLSFERPAYRRRLERAMSPTASRSASPLRGP
jgi:hypothetical protein